MLEVMHLYESRSLCPNKVKMTDFNNLCTIVLLLTQKYRYMVPYDGTDHYLVDIQGI